MMVVILSTDDDVPPAVMAMADMIVQGGRVLKNRHGAAVTMAALAVPRATRNVAFPRAVIGIDGNAVYALLGPDLMEGEAEFVEIDYCIWASAYTAERIAAGRALKNLKARLGLTALAYELGPGFRS